MNPKAIRDKFGDDYLADTLTFKMGIDLRFTSHIAERFFGLKVLETCTGAGFTTISLAKKAVHVYTVEVNPHHQKQAIHNIKKAGLKESVSFLYGDILKPSLLENLPPFDAAFIDPDWADTAADHEYRFINSNTQPPADVLLNKIFSFTKNIALVLPPYINIHEFDHLPAHECQKIYLGESHELFCLYFGSLLHINGETEFRVPL
jgi:tRNA G37 N-methylase Trm5